MRSGEGYARLRVNLDVRKPLRRGIFIKYAKEERSWLSFQYEKLPNFCFFCGKMGRGKMGMHVPQG